MKTYTFLYVFVIVSLKCTNYIRTCIHCFVWQFWLLTRQYRMIFGRLYFFMAATENIYKHDTRGNHSWQLCIGKCEKKKHTRCYYVDTHVHVTQLPWEILSQIAESADCAVCYLQTTELTTVQWKSSATALSVFTASR